MNVRRDNLLREYAGAALLIFFSTGFGVLAGTVHVGGKPYLESLGWASAPAGRSDANDRILADTPAAMKDRARRGAHLGAAGGLGVGVVLVLRHWRGGRNGR